MPVLEVDSVLHAYGEKRILSNVYLKCETGQVVGLLGRNGSGKSTLLQLIFGTLAAQNCSVRIDGKYYPKPYLQHSLLAYLPQHSFLPGSLRVQQAANIFLPDREARQQLLSDPVLQPLAQQRTDSLSGGQRRYLELQLLLHFRPQFLLLDEPFSGVEPLLREKIVEQINSSRSACGFILTDHYYRNVLEVSDRLVLLKDQRTISLTSPKQLEEFEYLPEGIL